MITRVRLSILLVAEKSINHSILFNFQSNHGGVSLVARSVSRNKLAKRAMRMRAQNCKRYACVYFATRLKSPILDNRMNRMSLVKCSVF